MNQKIAIIIGAGPAGLTAAYELLDKTNIKPIIIESSNQVGGISKTVNYKGNRIDIGGHRFFSKSDIVMNWWLKIMPLENISSKENIKINYHGMSKDITSKPNEGKSPDPEKSDLVMLIRNRLSRIFYLRKFFDYPITLNSKTISNLGIIRLAKIGISYLYIRLFPIKNEKTLEDFLINRFGNELYLTFFKDYTEKVWGTSCNEISAEWGAQRIKGLSITKALYHAIKKPFNKDKSIRQKGVETSLIEHFMYPKYGPGQMWEEVARLILERGGKIIMNSNVVKLEHDHKGILSVTYKDNKNDDINVVGDYFFSTMPVKDLVKCLGIGVPPNITHIADGLIYRDFITVGLLLNRLKVKSNDSSKFIEDNWIYIQERDVKVGRLQIFNNWSPYMVSNPEKIWIGLEYFCNEGDELWSKSDQDFINFAIDELCKIDIIEKSEVVDFTILRVPKTYPAYFGTYNKFNEIKDYFEGIENLFLVGRNGMHKYNNQDHSMLTAITAVENIIRGEKSKKNLWEINTEMDYHEKK